MNLRLEMHFNVRVEMRSPAEGARANRTSERTQIEMTAHVRAQILASRELVLAHVALERPKAGVNAQMHVQVAQIRERLRARETRVRLARASRAHCVLCALFAEHTFGITATVAATLASERTRCGGGADGHFRRRSVRPQVVVARTCCACRRSYWPLLVAARR